MGFAYCSLVHLVVVTLKVSKCVICKFNRFLNNHFYLVTILGTEENKRQTAYWENLNFNTSVVLAQNQNNILKAFFSSQAVIYS